MPNCLARRDRLEVDPARAGLKVQGQERRLHLDGSRVRGLGDGPEVDGEFERLSGFQVAEALRERSVAGPTTSGIAEDVTVHYSAVIGIGLPAFLLGVDELHPQISERADGALEPVEDQTGTSDSLARSSKIV